MWTAPLFHSAVQCGQKLTFDFQWCLVSQTKSKRTALLLFLLFLSSRLPSMSTVGTAVDGLGSTKESPKIIHASCTCWYGCRTAFWTFWSVDRMVNFLMSITITRRFFIIGTSDNTFILHILATRFAFKIKLFIRFNMFFYFTFRAIICFIIQLLTLLLLITKYIFKQMYCSIVRYSRQVMTYRLTERQS